MKRKRQELEDSKQDLPKINKKIAELVDENVNNKTTSDVLNLKSVCTFTYPNEVNSPFCLQSTQEYILLKSKTDNGIMKFEKNLGNHQTKFHLSSYKFKCSSYEAVESLKVDQKRLYNSSSILEKNDIMLRQDFFPNCVSKVYQVVKSQLSPSSNEDNITPVLASLSSHGSLELSILTYNKNELDLTMENIVELCDIRKQSFSLRSSYVKFKKLQEILNEITFRNFDWCPEIIDSTRFLAAVTKTNEIVVYSLDSENQVAVQKFEKSVETISELKWVVLNQNHFLFIANARGDLTRFSIEITEDGKVNSLVKRDDTKGKLNLAVSNIQAEVVDDAILILCAKAHSLEIFLFGNHSTKSITKYIGMSITGLASISNTKPEYLVTTLNNKIFYMQLSTENEDLKLVQYLRVDNSLNPEIHLSKYATYGIAASRNKVLVFIALYPKTMFDHLQLKQPLCVSVNTLPLNDPYQILLNNESLQLTDYYDCVEAVRFIGSLSLETLTPFESMDYRISMSEEFLYYLKIQRLTYDAKLVYYQSRSDMNFTKIQKTVKLVKKLIEVMISYFLLKFIATKKKKPSEQAQLSIRCMCNFIREFIREKIDKEPFKAAQEILKNDLEALLTKFKLSDAIEAEVCSYCDGTIDKQKLSCEHDHPLNRCVLTKLQIPFSENNICSNCSCCVMDLETLKSVTGKKSQFLCPYCDHQLTFG